MGQEKTASFKERNQSEGKGKEAVGYPRGARKDARVIAVFESIFLYSFNEQTWFMLEVHWVMSGNEVIWFDAQSAGTNASSKQTGARDDRRFRIISSQGDWISIYKAPAQGVEGREER